MLGTMLSVTSLTFVIGSRQLPAGVRQNASRALRSYVCPAAVTTGSRNMSRVMGQHSSGGGSGASPEPDHNAPIRRITRDKRRFLRPGTSSPSGPQEAMRRSSTVKRARFRLGAACIVPARHARVLCECEMKSAAPVM